MKKANIIVAAISVLLAAFLIWLWYFLGFDKVDAPLDLVMGLSWAIVVVILAIALNRQENARRELVRRVFYANGLMFNSEAGIATCSPDNLVANAEKILSALEYRDAVCDMPETFEYDYIVRTDSFDQTEVTDDKTGSQSKVVSNWTGSLFNRETGTEKQFSSKEELVRLVAQEVA